MNYSQDHPVKRAVEGAFCTGNPAKALYFYGLETLHAQTEKYYFLITFDDLVKLLYNDVSLGGSNSAYIN